MMPPLRFSGSAEDYPGSLIGQKIQVDRHGSGKDFGLVYPELNVNDTFTVVGDTPTAYMRLLQFKDGDGIISSGSAARFNVVPPWSQFWERLQFEFETRLN